MVDIDLLSVRLARAQLNIVTRKQLLEEGATRFQIDGAVSRGLLIRLHPGVFLVGDGTPTFEMLVLAAAWASKGLASHRTGAALFSLRRVPKGPIDISVEHRVPNLPDVNTYAIRGLDARDRTCIGIIPILHPAVILLQLAGAFPDLVEGALDDALVRRVTSLARVEQTLQRLGGKGRPGSGLLRELVEARRAGLRPTESALEDDFVALAREYRLELPVRQHPLALGDGPDARLDFADDERLLDFEVDGRQYHRGLADQRADLDRDTRVRSEGWLVRRFTTEQIRERPEEVVAVVRALQLRQR